MSGSVCKLQMVILWKSHYEWTSCKQDLWIHYDLNVKKLTFRRNKKEEEWLELPAKWKTRGEHLKHIQSGGDQTKDIPRGNSHYTEIKESSDCHRQNIHCTRWDHPAKTPQNLMWVIVWEHLTCPTIDYNLKTLQIQRARTRGLDKPQISAVGQRLMSKCTLSSHVDNANAGIIRQTQADAPWAPSLQTNGPLQKWVTEIYQLFHRANVNLCITRKCAGHA